MPSGMLLFFDTETTGKWNPKLPMGHPHQVRPVQIAAILANDEGREVMSMNFLVYQESVPAATAAFHGITTEILHAHGINEGTALAVFEEFLAQADLVIAHNGEFDQKIITNAVAILDGKPNADPFAGKKAFCTMRASTNICKLPSQRGGFKWPTLQEAYTHFNGVGFDGAHDALADVRACMNVFFHMQELMKPKQV
jgi:DNA polymerase-3 subunit epsilon